MPRQGAADGEPRRRSTGSVSSERPVPSSMPYPTRSQRPAGRGSARSARAKTVPARPAPFLIRPMEGSGYFMWVANQSSISSGSRWKCR